jgi:MFS family permease
MQSSAIASEGREEWRRDWKVPLAAMLGTGAVTIHFPTLSILIKPIKADTGWSLAEITASMFIYAVIVVLGSAPVGMLVDRIGAGKVATFGVLAYLLGFAAVGLAHSPLQWWVLWGLMSVAGLFPKSPIFALPVAKRFQKTRGVALAVMGCGLGIFSIFMPVLAQKLDVALGWRMAYAAMAGIVLIATWPIVFAVYGRKGFDADSNARVQARSSSAELPGPTWGKALRSRHLWQLTAAAMIGGFGVLSVQVHLAPMLEEKTMTPATVAILIGVVGVTSLAGRFLTGYLLDRVSPRLVGVVTLMLPVISCLLYLRFHGNVGAAVLIVGFFGFVAGSETDLMGFLTARYLGLRSYASCFSLIYALQALGGGGGPLLTSKIHDFYGGYDGAMPALIAALVIAAVLIATLGRAPSYETPKQGGDVAIEAG